MTTPADEAELEPGEEPEEQDDGEEEPPKPKMNPKKLLALIGIGLVSFMIIGGIISYFMGWMHSALGIEQEQHSALIELGEPTTHDLPVIKVDLKTGECKSPFLRAQVAIQLSSDDLERTIANQDVIMEQIQLHLRDQERADVIGKNGSNKLRFDLVNIINTVIAPSRIHGIIFKQFIVQ